MPNISDLITTNTANIATNATAAASAATAAASAGGANELIQKTTVSSSVTSIDFNSISAPQEQLVIMFNGLTVNAGYNHVHLQFLDSSGNNICTSNTFHYGGRRYGYVDSGGGAQTQQYIRLTHNNAMGATGTDFNGTYNIYRFGTTNPFIEGTGIYQNSSNEFNGNIVGGECIGTANAARIQIVPNTNATHFTGGSVYLYKLV